MTNRILKEMPSLITILAMFITGWFFYPSLPDKIPSHWNIYGEVDGYVGKLQGVVFIPLMTLGLYVLFMLLPYVDPKRENYKKFISVYDKLKFTMVMFFALLYLVTLLYSLGYFTNMNQFIIFATSAIFILLGNYFGKIRQNYFVGLKFPWTLADEEVWNKTHRLGGKLWVASGLIGIVSGFLVTPLSFKIFFGAIILSTVYATVYSYIIYRNKKRIES